ncbi:uncharacterized protein [Setaria viridis]|uniref:uncharacterized protein isoform X2 n=1 Tax=Setaria viridis TaxID=4556 RepID=UPI00149374A0|nr:uncharacterized protein LOC117835506 isoform X2 [Setaria viridis]
MAPPLEDLARVLAELAARLSRPPAGGVAASAGDALSSSISSLASVLNPNGDRGGASSGTRVLDAALSLMCFDPLEVNRARVDCLVRTLLSALSASVSCRVVRPDGGAGEEMLCVGSSVSPGDCRELLQSCAALVQKLGDCDAGRHSYDLLYAAAKTAVLSPHCQCLFWLPYYKEVGESVYDMGAIAAELIDHPSNHVPPSDNSIPLRLLLWHLDPSIIKHDLSAMLQEIIRRPLLCLRKELHNRMEWRIIIICLVCSPTMFMEMRSLLHFWFLATGLGSVLELHSALVSSALDILLKPMSWGISIELGQKFPFPHAYFPIQHSDLLAILTGPLSCKAFLDLVSCIDSLVHLDNTRTRCSSPKNSQLQPLKGLVKYNSAWYMIINFPVWFNFATALLFHRAGSQDYLSETISKETFADSISDVNLAQRAAFYLSWVLCPSNDDQCQMLANNVLEISHSWARNNKKHPSYPSSTVNHKRKLRLPTAADSETNSNCDMLLRYASTGQVIKSNEVQMKTNDHVSNDGFTSSCSGTADRWALGGAYLIFGWLDVVEDMSSLILDREDTCQHFLSQLRTKTGPYLLKCVKLLFEMLDEADQDRDFVIDLHNRLLNWDKHGQGCEIFGDVILKMNKKFKLP